MKTDPLLELLKANPNCRVTISFSRRRRHPAKPKPESGALKQRGWNWYRWDYSRTREGHAIVGPRGAYRWSWHFEREATPEEYKAWRTERAAAAARRKEAREATLKADLPA